METIVPRSDQQSDRDSQVVRDGRAGGNAIAIIVSDITRPCPTSTLLPFVLEELSCAGVSNEDIMIVFGVGSHRKHTEAEKESLVGPEIYREFRCVDSDVTKVAYLGETKRGTPVEVFLPVVQANLKIVLGNFEFHYFVGYSGGVKGAIPGVASLRTIQANHSLMVEPNAVAGHYEDNPVRQDIEEAGAMLGIDFVLNVVLDAEFDIVAAVAGDPVKSHVVGRKLLNAQNMVDMDDYADVVVVSAGGLPQRHRPVPVSEGAGQCPPGGPARRRDRPGRRVSRWDGPWHVCGLDDCRAHTGRAHSAYPATTSSWAVTKRRQSP